jgi:hypothetical protein
MSVTTQEILSLFKSLRGTLVVPETGTGASNELIARAELALDVKFPESYIWFCRTFVTTRLVCDDLFSVWEVDWDSISCPEHVVYYNRIHQQHGFSSRNHIIFADADGDEQFYIDTAFSDSRGENPVYRSDACEGTSHYAEDFLAFLMKRTLWWRDGLTPNNSNPISGTHE